MLLIGRGVALLLPSPPSVRLASTFCAVGGGVLVASLPSALLLPMALNVDTNLAEPLPYEGGTVVRLHPVAFHCTVSVSVGLWVLLSVCLCWFCGWDTPLSPGWEPLLLCLLSTSSICCTSCSPIHPCPPPPPLLLLVWCSSVPA